MAKHRRGGDPVNLKNSSKSRHINWQLDFGSYVDKLNPTELAWLDRFVNEYYRAAPRAEVGTRDQLRERWRDSKANARDVMSRGDAMSRRQELDVGWLHAGGGERHSEAEDAVIDRIDADRSARAQHDYGKDTYRDDE